MNLVRKTIRPATRQRHQALHDTLLDLAEAAIDRAGLPGLRARALAEAAGCSVGAIYAIFPDLDALTLAVNARTLDAIGDALRRAAHGTPAQHLVAIADAYLAYAAAHRMRWEALMQYRHPPAQALPGWYAERRQAAFSLIETPLAALRPGAPGTPALARTLFAAVHGVVALGLEAKVADLALPELRSQLRLVVEGLARGLATAPP